MSSTLTKYFSPFVNHEEELCLLQIFKPFYVLLSALGLFPQSITFPDGTYKTNVEIKNSTINSGCTIFIFVLIHSFFVFHLQELNISSKDNVMTENKMILISYTVALVMQILFCSVSYFRVICDRQIYIDVLNELADCWERSAMGKRRLILGRLRVHVNCVILVTVFISFLLTMLPTYIEINLTIWKIILTALTFHLPELVQIGMLTFYFVLVLMIVALLKNIEEELILILQLTKNNYNDTVEVDMRMDMSEVMKVYVKTLGLKRQVNAAFQAPILVALASSFLEIVIVPHLMYHGLAFQTNFSTQEIITCSTWFLNQLLKIYALARSGELLKSQVNEIGRTIHNIPIRGGLDSKVLLEVQHFSSLMTYQDSTITIYGYFPLDATLLFNMMASAAMYLVILVQFDKPE
ncbi:gustatory receptor 8a-like [Leguminivora glycinivorella]|uniref:gustatory receptor 8a-like n=1 Tax=Leguminivora glycinivorella TaxID=1035111 RepID=UPI0020106AB6|nr:gustatory receptor 8a-like [Leguminivora glycinivorella]